MSISTFTYILILQHDFLATHSIFKEEPPILVFGDVNFSTFILKSNTIPRKNGFKHASYWQNFPDLDQFATQCQHVECIENQKFNLMIKSDRSNNNGVFDSLVPGQYFNMLPGIEAMTVKTRLGYSFQKQVQAFGERYQIVPKTYIIPQQLDELKKKIDGIHYFIQKPEDDFGGHGIHIGNQLSHLNMSMPSVVQEYEPNQMLYKGHKMDLRVHVLITSVDPLIAYVWHSGFARITRHKHSYPNQENKDDVRTHISTVALNKYGNETGASYKTDMGENGGRQSIEMLRKFDEDDNGYDVVPEFNQIVPRGKKQLYIENQIKIAVEKCLVATYPEFLQLAKKNSKRLYEYPKHFFHIVGLDMYVTKQGQVKIFEANRAPLIEYVTNINMSDERIEVISESVNLIGVRASLDENGDIIVPTVKHDDDRIYLYSQQKNNSMTGEQLKKTKVIQFDKLTEFEKRAILQIKDEQTRIGNYKRLEFENYLEDFRSSSYMTQLLYRYLMQEKAAQGQVDDAVEKEMNYYADVLGKELEKNKKKQKDSL